jgi:hypothetical protein
MKKRELMEIVEALQDRVNKVEEQNEYLFDVLKQVRHEGVEMARNAEKKLPERWDELGQFEGWYINAGNVRSVERVPSEIYHRDIFASEKEARSALAMAQLSQLMKVYRGGWEPDWGDEDQHKHCITRWDNHLSVHIFGRAHNYLSFPTRELAEKFLENFESLIKEYFML